MRRLFRVNSLECLASTNTDDEDEKNEDFSKQEINEKIDNVNMDIIENLADDYDEDKDQEEYENEEEEKENNELKEIAEESSEDFEEEEHKGIYLLLNFLIIKFFQKFADIDRFSFMFI